MIYAKPGLPFTARLDGAPTGLTGTLGVRIERPDGTNAHPRQTTGILEVEPGSGIYIATITAPLVPSAPNNPYLVVWDTGGTTPTWAQEELTVTTATPVVDDTLRPTVDDVALLLRTRTVGGLATGLGGDTSTGDLTTFTAETRPSADEVDRVIDVSYSTVLGEITNVSDPQDIPTLQIGQVRHAIAIYAAIFIETSFFREQNNAEAIQTLRDLYAAAIAHVNGAMQPDGRTRRMVSATLSSPYSGDDIPALPELPL